MDTIVLGSFVLNFKLFMWLVSAIVGLFMLKHRWIASGADLKYSEKFTSALFIGILLWKFSFILFDLKSVIAYPMSILYFSGGDRGVLLGGVAALIYLAIKTKKDGTPLIVNVDALFSGWLAGNVVFYVLMLISSDTFAWENVGFLAVHFVIWLYLHVKQRFASSISFLYSVYVWYFVGMIAVPFLNENRNLVWLGLSAPQILFIILFFAVYFVGDRFRKTRGVK